MTTSHEYLPSDIPPDPKTGVPCRCGLPEHNQCHNSVPFDQEHRAVETRALGER